MQTNPACLIGGSIVFQAPVRVYITPQTALALLVGRGVVDVYNAHLVTSFKRRFFATNNSKTENTNATMAITIPKAISVHIILSFIVGSFINEITERLIAPPVKNHKA